MEGYAPAKVILSGEYAVLHGYPAFSVSADIWACVKVSPLKFPYVVLDLKNTHDLIIRPWHQDAFMHPQLGGYGTVLKTVLAGMTHRRNGFLATLESNIPMNSGLGSSAATLVALLATLNHFFLLGWTTSQICALARQAENFYHGNSSGLDVLTSCVGGAIRYDCNTYIQLPFKELQGYAIFTGSPAHNTETGVEHVSRKFTGDDGIWSEFGDVTTEMIDRYCRNDLEGFYENIRENHNLLKVIGVVPEKVRSFISRWELSGGAAKVSGAGACYGHNAGLVIAFGDGDIQSLCREYGYRCSPLQLTSKGFYYASRSYRALSR